MDSTADPVPRGFDVTTSDDGCRVICYRTSGMGPYGLFCGMFLGGWTVVCALFTGTVVFNANGVNYPSMLFIGPFWLAGVLLAAYAAWYFWSVTRFTFGHKELVVDRSLLWFGRRRRFQREEVTAVRQIKDGGDGDEPCPSWALAVVARTEVHVLAVQPIDKSSWLGPVIANWAGVSFYPWEPAKESGLAW